MQEPKPMKAITITIDELFSHKPWTLKPTFLGQPKIYGVRGIWNTEKQKLFTRQGNEIISVPHITAEIRNHRLRNMNFEGELYSDMINFEELQGIIRQSLNKGSNHFLRRLYSGRVKSIQLYVFDLISDNMNAAKRAGYLDLNCLSSENIFKLPAFLISNCEEAREFYNKCIDEGFEGAVFRRTTAKYGDKNALFRMKPINKMICRLIGWKDKGVVALKVKDGPEFYCSGMNERTQKILYYQYLVGSAVPILYDGFTKNGIPSFARIDNDLIN